MPEFPRLDFLPVENLLVHESHDNQRTRPLILRIRASGVWRNPPIVAPLQDGTARYMVLDGANRITALQEMQCPHALVQIVEPDDPGLSLQTWNHVVWEMNAVRFLTNIRDLPDLNLIPLQDPDFQPDLEERCGLSIVQTRKGRKYQVCCEVNTLEARVNLLNAIVRTYQDSARLDRTSIIGEWLKNGL
jgi:hypothetical protein